MASEQPSVCDLIKESAPAPSRRRARAALTAAYLPDASPQTRLYNHSTFSLVACKQRPGSEPASTALRPRSWLAAAANE